MAKKVFETYGVKLTGLQTSKFEWWLSNVNKKAPNTMTKEERK